MLRPILIAALLALAAPHLAHAQDAASPSDTPAASEEILDDAGPAQATAPAPAGPLQAILQAHKDKVAKASRRTVDEVITAVREAGLPQGLTFLERWGDRELWQREEDGLFFFTRKADGQNLTLIDIDTGEEVGTISKGEMNQLKPNSGVRTVIASSLVASQLEDADPARRRQALNALERNADESHLEPLRASIAKEDDPALKARKERLLRVITISFGQTTEDRVEAIRSFSQDLSIDARAALNPLVVTRIGYSEGNPEGVNVARLLTPGKTIAREDAYRLLVDDGKAVAARTRGERKAALEANIEDGTVGGVPVAELSSQEARDRAYSNLVADGKAPAFVTDETMDAELAKYTFYEAYADSNTDVTTAAAETLDSIDQYVGLNRFFSLVLDGISLASIYFLAAIGLAITFGVMGVINMAHGEFIMIGAYTGYVVQQIIPNYTVSIIVALPLAFIIAAAAGIALERLVIRHLASRPLETLLATFGVSIALQQIAKNVFGTQARPLTSPSWLDGAWVINDVVAVSYIRIAIFVLAILFFALLLFVLNRTRLGLEVRAVTQNPRMASSMGINPDRINMLTFALGSGIAGIAGVAIGLFAKVTSELGQAYIVQSFMTVVVGGVGNIWGTLAGATMIGFLQKVIEFFNPSNTLAAQTYMIIFIIIFIQFRPKGIIALKGRAAGD
ncbi:urea ABC transporter permease subunit UrtB [Pseudohoeflea suaedae]|uniref:Urea ABC transporter permease subunit UrtB n=1 Tax=Pseudohoeflea suaedae TaxID=877384 RepID=A0A4R5PQ00_9HYPH|nr:urea ABC transporter permease subunit UrtB [Pseudohoeflea suaedae]TDH38751.1 urea ABC transporter permease subunit UrtB [Pseudohoeflea suaedae]